MATKKGTGNKKNEFGGKKLTTLSKGKRKAKNKK